ncbi:SMI1/KNR4 family protein [Clostridium thermarum]|uniref:SMI1/KNR4 family protein n=1 Tax=Clostridium thermarum TaxID=1716543 RepID=UPI0013D50FA3|nr:SMI1/KNR4 family protein [Clostridium thermarum]
MWIEKITEYAKTIRLINIKPPATDSEIQKLRDSLGEIPNDLVKILKELNGDGCVLLSVDEIIETNMRLRTLDDYMPLDCLLFFAGNGSGDYYGYQIRKNGICPYNIFLWDHEYDNRTWVAGSMDDFVTKYCNGEI